ncbi:MULTISPECIES: hypothetical protein [Bacillus cereus group]|uniref:hypothetical protein n=1 Tax=Bacillus cereus group TaxID=86661 RepID=UPI0008FE11F4|nr:MULTISPECIES: hypothetical protein [Bacillus cereus group]HDR4423358.1 hypothetical protein [Bacillus cereus]MDG1620982.1 hypothetical protein [Bacillus mobilis]MDX5838218.1 hypothetical protein [Bacillus cereus group sp. BfR-BA-01700]MED4387494.1 hypothetical protein [Bacillus mobilis]OJE34182.1 hypothetical protein BAQ44_20330 [Bacillus mobilis]
MRLRVQEKPNEMSQVLENIGANKFFRWYCMDVIDESNFVIGEVIGAAIRMRAVKQDVSTNGGSAFLGISNKVDLFNLVQEFLREDELFFNGENRVYIIDRIEFLEGYRTIENKKKVIELTYEKMGALIYPFEGEEWMNNLSEEDQRTWEEHDNLLLDNGWEYNDDVELFFRRRRTTGEAIIRLIEEIEEFQEMLPDVLE